MEKIFKWLGKREIFKSQIICFMLNWKKIFLPIYTVFVAAPIKFIVAFYLHMEFMFGIQKILLVSRTNATPLKSNQCLVLSCYLRFYWAIEVLPTVTIGTGGVMWKVCIAQLTLPLELLLVKKMLENGLMAQRFCTRKMLCQLRLTQEKGWWMSW